MVIERFIRKLGFVESKVTLMGHKQSNQYLTSSELRFCAPSASSFWRSSYRDGCGMARPGSHAGYSDRSFISGSPPPFLMLTPYTNLASLPAADSAKPVGHGQSRSKTAQFHTEDCSIGQSAICIPLWSDLDAACRCDIVCISTRRSIAYGVSSTRHRTLM